MKKLFCFCFIVLALSACENQENVTPYIPVQDGIATRPLLPGDPNLNANWNWEGSQWTVYFRGANGNVSPAVNTVNPFFNDPVYGNADPAKIDMRASDGWMLVARDFGTPNDAPRIPWIIIYNKYRGLLRVCALKTSELLTTYQSTELSFDNSVTVPDLFLFVDETEQFATTKSGSQEWMVTEFNLQAYDASVHRQARFVMNFREVATHNVNLEGGGTIDGVAQPKPSKKSVSGTVYKVTSHTSKFWDKLPELGERTFKNIVKNIAKNPFAITSAAAGIIDALTGSGKAPTYNISLKADLSLDGTISLTTPRGAVEVYLRNDAVHSNQPRALQSIPWGVMNYSDAAQINQRRLILGPNRDDIRIEVKTPNGFFNNILILNPAISNDVVNIEAGWILKFKNNVVFRPLSQFQSIGFNGLYEVGSPGLSSLPEGVAVRITFANGDFVYNRFPVRYTFSF
ncbi:hypothetical protein FNH22_18920 [Fulvivirga sp. M361]|uniref:hypothetical protein n=1 Tax=Fulvivirga sp. M361 TaxID=2594266 RepID=UPI00117B4E36|nr:hypothetical protein [Fulvivirga sp. M361]TRX54828.1 hypothetical protein FNH22_18920 [Fulvivirga sp. M361]